MAKGILMSILMGNKVKKEDRMATKVEKEGLLG